MMNLAMSFTVSLLMLITVSAQAAYEPGHCRGVYNGWVITLQGRSDWLAQERGKEVGNSFLIPWLWDRYEATGFYNETIEEDLNNAESNNTAAATAFGHAAGELAAAQAIIDPVAMMLQKYPFHGGHPQMAARFFDAGERLDDHDFYMQQGSYCLQAVDQLIEKIEEELEYLEEDPYDYEE